MGLFTKILELLGILPTMSELLSPEGRAGAMRAVLNNRCPLCGGNLAGHSHGGFAAFKIDGAKIRNRMDARERLFSEDVDRLPNEGENDPERDLVWYAVLTCPNLKEDALIEHYSGADVFSEESAVKLEQRTVAWSTPWRDGFGRARLPPSSTPGVGSTGASPSHRNSRATRLVAALDGAPKDRISQFKANIREWLAL